MFYNSSIVLDDSDPLFFIVSIPYAEARFVFALIPFSVLFLLNLFLVIIFLKTLGDRGRLIACLRVLFGSGSTRLQVYIYFYDSLVVAVGGQNWFRF